jgi:copper oxidase (laccase) domain-containing protein
MQHCFLPIPNKPGKYLADLYQLARDRLKRVGMISISGGDLCTVLDQEQFFSYRRNGVTGRFASLIWISP